MPNTLTYSEQLESFVCFNKSALIDKETSDYIQLRVMLKLTGIAKFASRFFKVRDHRKYILTGYSYELFKQIRETPLRLIELIEYLEDSQKLSFFEARALTLNYVAMLMRRGLAAVEVPTEAKE